MESQFVALQLFKYTKKSKMGFYMNITSENGNEVLLSKSTGDPDHIIRILRNLADGIEKSKEFTFNPEG